MDEGVLTVSLDLELYWGRHDRQTLAEYSAAGAGIREAVPRLLDLFEDANIHCTWAVVGFLFFDDRDELLASLPERLPGYRRRELSPYRLLAELGAGERAAPFQYGRSLLRQIQACPGQEIGTHTFSHYYCLEDGQTPEEFRADLQAAFRAAERLGIALRSLVFPRNQVSAPHLRVAAEVGLQTYRGVERSWVYRSAPSDAEGLLKRGWRLADSYVPLTGPNCTRARRDASGLVDVASSRLLRPATGRRLLDRLRLERICDAMQEAAMTATVYHLWFHPESIGRDLASNLRLIRGLLAHFARLRDAYGMRSLSMAEVAAAALAVSEVAC